MIKSVVRGISIIIRDGHRFNCPQLVSKRCFLSSAPSKTLVNHRLPSNTSITTSSMFSTSSNIRQKSQKQRKQRKQSASGHENERLEAVAFCTAEEYNYHSIKELNICLNPDPEAPKYQVCNIDPEIGDDALLVRVSSADTASSHSSPQTSQEPGHGHGTKHEKDGQVFIFRDLGSVVFWNVPNVERTKFLDSLSFCHHKPVHEDIVHRESESMDYVLDVQDTSNNDSSQESHSKLVKGTIFLASKQSSAKDGTTKVPAILDQYSFSNAIALSVKLASHEANLDKFSETIQILAEEMRDGKKIKLKEKDVFQRSGQLFTLRHSINLNSDFLDTPDFYWDRPSLETLFNRTCSILSISRRARIFNDKLTYCYELLQLLQTHLADKHSAKLEWYIIILIGVEIFFEFFHTFKWLLIGE